MWNWPKSDFFKKELFSIIEEMKKQDKLKEGYSSNYAIDAIEDLQYAILLSVIATEQHCQTWLDFVAKEDCDIEYQDTIYEFVKKVNKILSEEQWSFE